MADTRLQDTIIQVSSPKTSTSDTRNNQYTFTYGSPRLHHSLQSIPIQVQGDEKLDNLVFQLGLAQRRLQQTQKRYQSLRGKYLQSEDRNHKQVISLQSQLEQYQETEIMLQDSIRRLQLQNDSLRVELQGLKREKTGWEVENSLCKELERWQEATNLQLKKAQEQIISLKAQNKRQLLQISALNLKLKTWIQESDAKHTQLELHNSAIVEKNLELIDQVESNRDRVATLTKKIQTLKKELSLKNQEMNSLKQKHLEKLQQINNFHKSRQDKIVSHYYLRDSKSPPSSVIVRTPSTTTLQLNNGYGLQLGTKRQGGQTGQAKQTHTGQREASRITSRLEKLGEQIQSLKCIQKEMKMKSPKYNSKPKLNTQI